MRRFLVGLIAVVVVSALAGVLLALTGGEVVVTRLQAPLGDEGSGGALAVNDRGEIAGARFGRAVLWLHGEARDLGVLGSPLAVSERGDVVGGAWDEVDTAAGFWEEPSYLWLSRAAAPSFLVSRDGEEREGFPTGCDVSGMNGRGWVALTCHLDPFDLDSYRHAFLWVDGALLDLGVLPGQAESLALGLNGRGQVIGTSGDRAFVWSPTDTSSSEQPVAGTMRAMSGLQTPLAINDRGQVVVTSAFGTTAVLWENGDATSLGSLGGRHSVAQAINEQGQVAGTSTTPGGDRHLFLWENGTMTDLGTLGGRTTAFRNDLGSGKLNERGQVVGWSQTKTGEWHAFVWHNGTMIDLGTLAGDRWSSAEAVNNRGEIVGWSSPTRDGERHAVAWTLLGG